MAFGNGSADKANIQHIATVHAEGILALTRDKVKDGASLDLEVNAFEAVLAYYVEADDELRRVWDAVVAAMADPDKATGDYAPGPSETYEGWRLRMRVLQFRALMKAGCKHGIFAKTPLPTSSFRPDVEKYAPAT